MDRDVDGNIPVARCGNCEHNIYGDEGFTTKSNDNTNMNYFHKKCPVHKSVITNVIIVKRCEDCGVEQRFNEK